MKWWYVLVLMVGIGIGWWLWSSYGVKTATPVEVIKGKNVSGELAKTSTTQSSTFNKQGSQVKVKMVEGIVQSWDPEKGYLEISVDGKIWALTIDLAETRMVVNSLKHSNIELVVTSNTDLNWRGGFCPADHVVASLDGEKVISIINNGYRRCGFKDK